jgi:hypothetical protein
LESRDSPLPNNEREKKICTDVVNPSSFREAKRSGDQNDLFEARIDQIGDGASARDSTADPWDAQYPVVPPAFAGSNQNCVSKFANFPAHTKTFPVRAEKFPVTRSGNFTVTL